MTFVSIKFLIFLTIFLIIFRLWERNGEVQNLILLIGNYIFYSLIDIRFSAVLFIVSLFTWFITSERIIKHYSKIKLVLGILMNIIILIFFKYIGFFRISNKYGLIMPIGLSFYIFESISFIVDWYNDKIDRNTSLFDVLIYLSFFPIVMAGPIVKARDFMSQIHSKHYIKLINFENGIQRFCVGMFEKVVIADRLAASVNAVYSAPAAYSGLSLLINSFSYSLQLFFDFTGYSNMAIGIATILGFSIKENFNLPYIAKNPSDFWKRWHISLSSWLTEYVYIPLGGNRKGIIKTCRNILFVMLVSGLWHGSTINFIIWGIGHGLIQVVYKLFFQDRIKEQNNIGNILGIIITFILINLLWIPFRCDSIATTLLIFKRIFLNAKGLTYIYSYTIVFGLILLIIELYSMIANNSNNPIKPLNLRTFKGKFVFVTLLLIMAMFAYFGNSAFIYGSMF